MAKFALVGVVNTLISYGFFSVLVYAGCHYLLASVMSYALGASVSYWLNAAYTFSVMRTTKGLFKFILLSTVAILFGMAVLHILIEFMFFSAYIAQACVVVLRFPLVYVLSHSLVFNLGLQKRKTD
ncbi:putative membrane protein [Shewanella psychrophila]|uniref:Putative membrane protein n=2 Tax=Shewanella psychrophila TaxID=225848 RepID=A0A1S6HK77_9GAMM|nr:putative membrane protein [Shewanella psychrophila]